MDIKLKQAALKSLAQIEGESAKNAITKEVEKISVILEETTQYDKIEDQLELLDAIAYRVSKEAVNIVTSLLTKLENLTLTYQDIQGYPPERLQEFQNNNTLIIKSLEILEHIRYHEAVIPKILDTFFNYSCHDNEDIKKRAIDSLELFADYNINIFYGNKSGGQGIGSYPQEKVLDKILSFDDEQKMIYFSGIITCCNKILSPTICGTSSDYNTVTWSSSAVPAADDIKEIRKKTLNILNELYYLANSVEQKKSVIYSMDSATRTPHTSNYGNDVLNMILADTITVLRFMRDIVSSEEEMQVMQKIEHDAYWFLYHKGSLHTDIHKITLEIRDILYANKEYKIFRILIGFESIFHDWEKSKKEEQDFEKESNSRELEALKLAKEINNTTYPEWKKRIIDYASIKSDDLATFPHFGKFLEHFGEFSPELALQLLSESSDELKGFIIAILCGVSKTKQKDKAYKLIASWCDEDKHLFHLAHFFEYSAEINEDLLNKIMKKAKSVNDLNTLNQIIVSVSAQYKEDSKHLIKKFFVPTLKILTTNQKSNWIFGVWFRAARSDMLANMNKTEHQAILDNLLWLNEVDYHAEEILCEIAKKSPKLVLHFFCNRLSREKDDDSKYEAIPYAFQKLSEPLSIIPDEAVDAVLEMYDGKYGLFIYRGAKLLKNIFRDFSDDFQKKLLQVIESKKENDLLFVMAILKNYDGNSIIQNMCKELIKVLPDNDSLSNEVSIILQSTGVVSGEYGFVEVYNRKIDEIKPWLEDDNEKVKTFAVNYITSLEEQIEYERKRSDESIALRKHQYGENND